MTEEVQGERAPAEEAVAAETPVQEPDQAVEAAPEQEVDDALFDAMEAEQFGDQEQPEKQDFTPGNVSQDIREEVAAELAEEPARPDNWIDPDREYLIQDSDGNEYTVKGSDAIYQTSQYHRKMQQLDDELKQYKPLENMFQHEKGRLAAEVLKTADPAERLATISQILRDSGLGDLSGQIDERMQANNLQYYPMQQQYMQLQQQRMELENQQRQMQAQSALQQDTAALESRLGRSLSARELGGINNVYQQWLNARTANPSLARPSFDAAYKMAQDAIKFEDSQRLANTKPKPRSPVERARRTSKPDPGILSEDDLFTSAMAEQGISY